MSSFLLKIIACITMIFDHFGYIVYNGKTSFFNFIGRISFPIFAFQISEGYIHTKNLKKYMFKLLIFAIISQYPFIVFYNIISSGFSLNIFFTLFLGLSCIIIYDKFSLINNQSMNILNKIINIFVCIGIAYLAEFIHCDYGFYGVTIILLFYIFKSNNILMTISFILTTILKYSVKIYKYGIFSKSFWFCVFTILPIIFINLYNKKQGKKIKYFLYIFYPVHLLLICILWNIIHS